MSTAAEPTAALAPHDARVVHASLGTVQGVVAGPPRHWLRLEGATLAAGALLAYTTVDRSWWLLPLALMLPDITMVGYLAGRRLGAHLYNLAHSTPLPAAVLALGWWQDRSLAVALALIWLAHIGLDRLIGYGLKYGDDFRHTHLGQVGRTA